MEPSKTLLQAIAVTAELTGTQMSDGAAKVMAADLARYPEAQILEALTRCRRELKGRLTIADVLTRIDDGRPGPEEAWGLIPHDESSTVVWTEEMAQAFGAAYPLIRDGETIPARMAFLERYKTLCREARDEGRPVKWAPTLGHDPIQRETVLLEAAQMGRLPRDYVAGLLPHRALPAPEVFSMLPDLTTTPDERRSLKAALEEARKGKAA